MPILVQNQRDLPVRVDIFAKFVIKLFEHEHVERLREAPAEIHERAEIPLAMDDIQTDHGAEMRHPWPKRAPHNHGGLLGGRGARRASLASASLVPGPLAPSPPRPHRRLFCKMEITTLSTFLRESPQRKTSTRQTFHQRPSRFRAFFRCGPRRGHPPATPTRVDENSQIFDGILCARSVCAVLSARPASAS